MSSKRFPESAGLLLKIVSFLANHNVHTPACHTTPHPDNNFLLLKRESCCSNAIVQWFGRRLETPHHFQQLDQSSFDFLQCKNKWCISSTSILHNAWLIVSKSSSTPRLNMFKRDGILSYVACQLKALTLYDTSGFHILLYKFEKKYICLSKNWKIIINLD